MKKAINIRPYLPQDKDSVLELMSLLVPTYFAEEEIADLDHYLDQEIELYFVAERQGKIVAAAGINFEKAEGIGKLSWDFVHPEAHGQGLGTKLLQHRIHILQSLDDIKTISVRTSQMAYRFYEKNGFETVAIKKDFWAPGFDMYKMLYRG
ncbi:GNAT family N-acetyltransferase [Sphingobacterium oryzagri]|uniref:GNAT family N-acetyltransferase n=1 Tax=Sphingobacterium oryzagri TaxID=3025669 RepID=A0ABY7WKN0_9SPHI|nr:GNAT family N-acetyltransferase [Sphingobacterium sp. KACC 22765]WDF70157.1 GNAT family N-acetyltransferase [Sphingobacterium sp. KACC 22765]